MSQTTQLKTFYFTFGCGQKFANHYVQIDATDSGAARDIMFMNYGPKWSFQYDANDYAEAIEPWNYKLLALITQPLPDVAPVKSIKVIKADGTIIELAHKPDLKAMQQIVGGYIEHVTVLDRIVDGEFIYSSMFVNEEGLITGLPRNDKATCIYQRNIRAAFPGPKNPFLRAEEAAAEQAAADGFTMIETREPDYIADPYVCGDVIYFEGYTREEVDA